MYWTLSLSVPHRRDGKFLPNAFDRCQRNEKALFTSMLEMYISGVSTRKVSQIVEELRGKKVSKSFISDLTQQLDPMVKKWQFRSLLETKFPFIMVNVLYIKVREEYRVISKSCRIALGITAEGEREIIGLMIQNGESDESWSIFFDYLKQRGPNGTEFVISDAHAGLISSIRKLFAGASWQICQVYSMRNILSSVPKKDSKPFRETMKTIFRFSDIGLARIAKNNLLESYADKKPIKRGVKN